MIVAICYLIGRQVKKVELSWRPVDFLEALFSCKSLSELYLWLYEGYQWQLSTAFLRTHWLPYRYYTGLLKRDPCKLKRAIAGCECLIIHWAFDGESFKQIEAKIT